MKKVLLVALVSAATNHASAQEPTLAWTARLLHNARIVSNVTYLTASNWEAKRDLYLTRTPETPRSTMIFVHGGGWTGGAKENSVLAILPYLDMGMNVVNVEYRLARVAPAPAAVEASLAALKRSAPTRTRRSASF